MNGSLCFDGILDCVHLVFYTHNVTLVRHFCSTKDVWMLMVLQLHTSVKIDNSQYLEGCANSMLQWKFWEYAECTMDISGVDDYRNCSLDSSLSVANPVLHLPGWVYGIPASLAFLLVLVSIALCAYCCRKRAKSLIQS